MNTFYKSCKGKTVIALFKVTEEDDYYHLRCLETENDNLFEVDSYYYIAKDKLTKPINGYTLTVCPDEEEVLLHIKHGKDQ